MKTLLILVGKTTDKHFQAGITDYVERIGHYMPFELVTIPELKNTKSLSEEQQKTAEGELILKQIQPSDTVVLLDEHGREWRSIEFARWLEQKRNTARRLIFVIGGPYGFSPAVYARANEQLSLSKMTFSHQMIRLVFTLRMKQIILSLTALLLTTVAPAENRTYRPEVKSLQAVVNQDWLSPAVMQLKGDDVLYIGFDELSHDYHRYVYRLERCEADWTTSQELFESDWLQGFNHNVIEQYERSINTTVPYTHYGLQIPNDRCRLIMSGNYRLHIMEDGEDEDIATVEFMVTEQTMGLSIAVTTNTDIDTNECHQQVSFNLNYNNQLVTSPEDQIQTVVMQNAREDNWRRNVRPSYISQNGLQWQHQRRLIFDGGNEYRKFEILDPRHPTLGIEHVNWDGTNYQAQPYIAEPRLNYLYDEDADGAFYIRNSDNIENDFTSDYVWVNYRLKAPQLPSGRIVIEGRWTTETPSTYLMDYDATQGLYTANILQKLGYYSYQYLWLKEDGTREPLPSEGNFYETENRYQVLVYYKGTGERTWRLTAYGQIIMH